MRIPVTDLLSIQEEQDKEKRYGPVVVSLIQITRLRPNRVCFLRLATLPMPRGQGHAPMPVPVAPWRRYCTRSCGRGRRKYPQVAAAAIC